MLNIFTNGASKAPYHNVPPSGISEDPLRDTFHERSV